MNTTPIEKAKELVDKFTVLFETPLTKGLRNAESKESAIICVDEIIELLEPYVGMHSQEYFDSEKQYWVSVKEQILLL